MSGKIYLVLLILCGIWTQGIIGAFANENIDESLSFLVRQKRVISNVSHENIQVRIEEHSYITNIRLNNRIFCVGTIISPSLVLTAAEYAQSNKSNYKVISGSARSNIAIRSHDVTEIDVLYGNYPQRTMDGIALFTIHPAVVYSATSNKINLHVEPVPPGVIGTVTGWGYNKFSSVRGTQYPLELRSIKVPIMAHRECVNRYQRWYPISDKDLCTFHPLRRTGDSDAGAPLVIDNYLVGIFLRRGPMSLRYNSDYPDVFALLQHTYYRRWIKDKIKNQITVL